MVYLSHRDYTGDSEFCTLKNMSKMGFVHTFVMVNAVECSFHKKNLNSLPQ